MRFFAKFVKGGCFMKKLGIIGAMDVEVALLRKNIVNPLITRIAAIEFIEGTINGTPVVVAKSGIGKVNAAVCTQLLIRSFDVTGVVNTGAAGAFASGLGVLDLVISTDVMYHDVDVTAWGYEAGGVPGLPVAFKADETFVSRAEEVCKALFPERNVVCGRVASGDQFISSAEKKQAIRALCAPACVEMEGAAVAHVCTLNAVPFVVVRSMSDMADDDGGRTAVFNEKAAGETSAALVIALLERL